MITLKPKPNWKKVATPLGLPGEWYRWGDLTVCLGSPTEEGGWHISISHPSRYPSWDEIFTAWYDLVPVATEITGAIILPRSAEYVNLHPNCFHVHQLNDVELPAGIFL